MARQHPRGNLVDLSDDVSCPQVLCLTDAVCQSLLQHSPVELHVAFVDSILLLAVVILLRIQDFLRNRVHHCILKVEVTMTKQPTVSTINSSKNVSESCRLWLSHLKSRHSAESLTLATGDVDDEGGTGRRRQSDREPADKTRLLTSHPIVSLTENPNH